MFLSTHTEERVRGILEHWATDPLFDGDDAMRSMFNLFQQEGLVTDNDEAMWADKYEDARELNYRRKQLEDQFDFSGILAFLKKLNPLRYI